MSSQDSPHTHHAIDYIELTMRNLDEAKRFYAAAFDWRFNDYGPSYAGIAVKEREMGGFSVGEPSTGAGPLVVLFSHDLDATLLSVRDAGGIIAKEPFPFPGGRRFHFVDPSGNELAVWSQR